MRTSCLAFACLLACISTAVAGEPSATKEEAQSAGKPRQLVIADKPWKGDFNQMIERRMIRMLVPYGRTLY